MDGIFHLVQMTATYSNAVLVAILPHFTDVAQKLELPFPTPITRSEIRRYFCDPRAGEIGGWVVLTNGYQFWYEKGHVRMFHSPRDYFILQDPDLIPKLYGHLNMNQQEAVTLAQQSLKKLGYTNDLFYTTEPEVKLATSENLFAVDKGVPQYKIIWHDPDLSHRRPFDELAEVDVNAEVKHIDGFVLDNKRFWKSNPNVGVVPEALPQSTTPTLVGGRKLAPVSVSFSNACLAVLLPQISDYAQKLQLPISLPISMQDCSNIDCSMEDGQPNLQIILGNGDRFNFRHGYVMDFYAGDNYFTGDLYGQPVVNKSTLYQSQPVSKSELIEIARQAVRRLGYSEKELNMAAPPDMVTIPEETGANHYFTRYEIAWDYMHFPSGMDGYRVAIEVDAKSKTIKSISLDNTNLWRHPPKIDVPLKPQT